MPDELGNGEAEVTETVEDDEGEEGDDSLVPEPEAIAGEGTPALDALRAVENVTQHDEATSTTVIYRTSRDAADRGDIFAIGKKPETDAIGDTAGYQHLNLPGQDWTIAKNDAWTQGGIDGGAPFGLASEPTSETIADPKYFLSVFGRELRQLHNAGFDLTDAHLGDILERSP